MPPTKRAVKRVAAPPRDLDERDIDAPEANGDDDDDRPARPAKKATARVGAAAGRVRRGWGAGQETMDSTSTFAQSFQPADKAMVIKFLEDEPYASFRRHWIESTNKEGQRINRPYTCPVSFDDDCPLCEVGDRPQAVSAFNIAVIADDGTVSRKSWDVGARLFNVLKSYANDTKIAPLTRGYFIVSKTGKKGSTQYNVIPVKATALEEDYDVPVPEQSELDRLDLYDIEIVEVTPKKVLRELAAELSDED